MAISPFAMGQQLELKETGPSGLEQRVSFQDSPELESKAKKVSQKTSHMV